MIFPDFWISIYYHVLGFSWIFQHFHPTCQAFSVQQLLRPLRWVGVVALHQSLHLRAVAEGFGGHQAAAALLWDDELRAETPAELKQQLFLGEIDRWDRRKIQTQRMNGKELENTKKDLGTC